MTFENEDILPNFVKEQTINPTMQSKINPATGQIVYRCQNDFGALDWRELRKMLPKIVDFGLATRLDGNAPEGKGRKEEIGLHPIQPDQYRAPEVILGCGWSFSADIWNFGVIVSKKCLPLRSFGPQNCLSPSHSRWSYIYESGKFSKTAYSVYDRYGI